MAYRLFTFSKNCYSLWKHSLVRNISLIPSSKKSWTKNKQIENKLMNFYFKKLTRLPSLQRFHNENHVFQKAPQTSKTYTLWPFLMGSATLVLGGLTFGKNYVFCEGTHDKHHDSHSKSFRSRHRKHSKDEDSHSCIHHSPSYYSDSDDHSYDCPHHKKKRHRDEIDYDDHIRHRKRHRGHSHSHNRCDRCSRKYERHCYDDLCEGHRRARNKDSVEECQNMWCDHGLCERCARKKEKFISKSYSSIQTCKTCEMRNRPSSGTEGPRICEKCSLPCMQKNSRDIAGQPKYDRFPQEVEDEKSKEVVCYQMAEYDEKGQKYERFDWDLMWQAVAPDMKYLGLAIASAVAIGFLNIEIPLIVRDIVTILTQSGSKLFEEDTLHAMMTPGLKLITLYLAFSVFSFSHDVSSAVLKERIHYRFATDLFETLLRQDIVFFDARYTGEMLNRLTSDVQMLVNSFMAITTLGVNLSIQVIGSAAIMFTASPLLSTIPTFAIPCILFVGKLFSEHLKTLPKEADEEMEKGMSIAEESLSNMRAVRVLAMEEREFEKFENHILIGTGLQESYNLGMSIYKIVWNVCLSGIVVGLGFWGARMVAHNEMEPEDMVSFILATQMMRQALTRIAYVYEQYVEGQVSGARVFEYFHRTFTIPLKGGDIIPLDELCGSIHYKDVTFTYPCHPDVPVFENLDFKIPPSKTVAVCGKSGGGKSSLANLLVRFYDVQEGSLLIDGRDIKTLDPEWLRGHVIGYVMQDSVLFAVSVMENIRYARPNATDEEVIRASKLANAHEFIMSWPEGYDTILGERGVNLSGGQRKRIAIARALVKDPCILIVDEVTSSLDSESEKIVLQTLKKISKDRTVLILTHCGAPMDEVDIIAGLDKGKIVELGTPKELMAKKGFYYKGLKEVIKAEDNET